MKRPPMIAVVLAGAGLAIGAGVWLAPRLDAPRTLSGYIEGEPLYMAAPVAGTLVELAVERGQAVRRGQKLFTVDPQQSAAALDRAQAAVEAAQAQAADARKGERPVELAVYDAQVAAARARAQEAQAELRRVVALAETGVHAQARLDNARAAAETAQADLAAAERRRQAAALGAREDQAAAAESRVREAAAQAVAARAQLADQSPAAPADALVEDVYFRPGEWTPAQQPVLSLLPAERVRLRFFAPQNQVAAYRPGREVSFSCDGCPGGLTAKITYVSPRPEFTPPVIYSRESRDRMVFMVEAAPSQALTPGLPVDVTPLAPEAGR